VVLLHKELQGVKISGRTNITQIMVVLSLEMPVLDDRTSPILHPWRHIESTSSQQSINSVGSLLDWPIEFIDMDIDQEKHFTFTDGSGAYNKEQIIDRMNDVTALTDWRNV
jgi:hypothetical protein